MPEEKKEKKATPFFSPKEEKKKDSFTFSDKIKDSKPAASKSFANRISSKIGRDGKPKQTIFERTKRDAPFLIAALVALLLLPFLYKFSGSVSEEPLVTPGSEYSDFDPDRRDAFGFDTVDPEGQISQLSGRDSLSLIKGLGGNEEEEGAYDASYEGEYRGSYEGSSESARGSASDTNVDIEENTTNIYKKRAKAGTRAAFRRATKINGLPPATKTRGSGDKLAVGNWGGRMKEAAKKVKGNAPTSSPKPVSLQPLQAAAKPNRTAFGNTAAAQRQSKDALGKADAKQAILDAMVKPVEPGAFGGLTMGDGSFGGGGADLKREFNYNGKEPWWWDMMKTRSQKLWERYWQRKWKWEDWLDDIKMHILGGIINCLVTGHDEGDMGSMFGTGEGGKAAKCCGQKEKAFFLNYPQYKGVSFEEACSAFKKTKDGKELCKNGDWEGGTPKTRRGFFGSRLNCLGFMGSKYKDGPSLSLQGAGEDCDTFVSAHEYTVVPEGKAKKWHIYHYVTARNYVPKAMKEAGFEGKYLCAEDSDVLSMGSKYSAGPEENFITQYNTKRGQGESWYQYLKRVYGVSDREVLQQLAKQQQALDMMEQTSVSENKLPKKKQEIINDMGNLATNGRKYASAKQTLLTDLYELNPEEVNNACVVYLVQGNQFEYGNFQRMVKEGLQKLITEKTGKTPEQAEVIAKEAFGQMDFFFIESVAMDKKLGYAKWGKSGNDLPLPMLYNRFFNAYVYKQGVTANEGSRKDVNKRKFRDAEDYTVGKRCDFDMDVHLECQSSVPPIATIKKGDMSNTPVSDISVTAIFKPGNTENSGVAEFSATLAPVKRSDPANTYVRTFTQLAEKIPEGKTASGEVRWTISYQRNGQAFTQNKTCLVNMSPEPAPPVVHNCTDGETRVGADGCKEICKSNAWVKEDPNCPTGPVDPSKVKFYPKFSIMPTLPKVLTDTDPKDRPALTDNELPKQWPGCKIDDLSAALLEVYDPETHTYMEQAVAKYTADNQTTKEMVGYVEQTAKKPTIAQVVDAMRISQAVGITDVPKNTVCAVARTIGHISRDPHAGHKDAKSGKYDNTFGAFAAYINYDSSFYPTMRLTDTNNGNNIEIDLRYHGCWDQKRTNQAVDTEIGGKMHAYAEDSNNSKDVGTKKCGGTNNTYSNSDKECSSFHYGHYNWNHYTQGDLASKPCAGDPTGKACLQNDRSPYEAILDASIWGAAGAKFPLAALAKPAFQRQWGKNLQAQYRNGTIDSYNRTKYHLAYDAVFHKGEGVSCGYGAGETMKVEDALRYIDSLCNNGIERKPGNGGQINCDHYYYADHDVTRK